MQHKQFTRLGQSQVPLATPRTGPFYKFTVAIKFIFAWILFSSAQAWASDYDVVKQKNCTVLLKPTQGLSKGQVLKAQSSSGKSVTIRIVKVGGASAQGRLSPKSGKCTQVSGQTLSLGRSTASSKKFQFGVAGNFGLFTFRQPFIPLDPEVEPGSEEQKKQTVVGLSGLGFSAGIAARYSFKPFLGLELGTSFLSTTITGKSKLTNGDDYLVEAKFAEAVVQPALVLPQCISSRLFCKVGGIVAFPLSATLTTKSQELDETATVKYTRIGAEGVLGVNLGKSFTLLGGAQICNDSGSFQFDPSKSKSRIEGIEIPTEAQSIKVLTVFAFGGFSVVF